MLIRGCYYSNCDRHIIQIRGTEYFPRLTSSKAVKNAKRLYRHGMTFEECFTEKMRIWGKPLNWYNSNNKPHIIDGNLLDTLSPIERTFVMNTDYPTWMYYRGNHANNIYIVVVFCGREHIFCNYDRFKKFIAKQFQRYCRAYVNGIVEHEEFTSKLSTWGC